MAFDPIGSPGSVPVLAGLKSGALKRVIAKTSTFDDIVEAHRYLASNARFGKVL